MVEFGLNVKPNPYCHLILRFRSGWPCSLRREGNFVYETASQSPNIYTLKQCAT